MSERVQTVVENDVVVSLAYTLTVDGEIIDSTDGKNPLEYLHGYQNIIPGLENELKGLGVGETRQVKVLPADGYGEFDPEAFADIERNQFPEGFNFQIGQQLRVGDPSGRVMTASIAEIGDDMIKIDLNHPLAGKELFFDAKIVALRDATPDELASGRVGGGCSSCGSGGCSDNGGCGDSDGCGDGCGSGCC